MAKPKSRKLVRCQDYRHPSEDRSERFALDALIRQHGYRIFRRKSGKPTLWCRTGRLYSQEMILSALDPERVWGAEYAESLYWEGLPSFVELSVAATGGNQDV